MGGIFIDSIRVLVGFSRRRKGLYPLKMDVQYTERRIAENGIPKSLTYLYLVKWSTLVNGLTSQ